MSLRFAVTWDYRCPFARNAHEHVLAALADGAEWEVRFVPFSLGQVHVAEGEPAVWERPETDTGLLALQAGVVVRDQHPGRFPAVHAALFAARHDQGRHLRDQAVVRDVLEASGVDADAVLAEVATGAPLETIRKEHEEVVASHDVWGVPTFLSGDRAAFVRLMDRPAGDAQRARRSVEHVLDLLDGWVELNEFKHTSLQR
ncbi:MAG: DsbA family protein [Acidimicrobiales bacterium]|nr:DsbA family protein [Acidimicrobiales bacterium]